MNVKKTFATVATLASSAYVATGSILAQAPPTINVRKAENVKITDVGVLISSFVGVALLASALLVFGFLILGGIQWITSGGDKGKTESARNKITAAIVGLAIVASSYALMQIIAYFFGIKIFDSGIQETLVNIKPY